MSGKISFNINTPSSVEVTKKSKGGSVKLKLSFTPGFGSKKSAAYGRAQEFVDSECLRRMNPLTPMRSGDMINSATRGTTIGSGQIEYSSPYARRQYYENEGGSPGHPSARKLWFETMKGANKESIKKGAAKIISGE